MSQYTTSQVAIEITNFVKTGTDYKGNLSTFVWVVRIWSQSCHNIKR